MNTQNAATARRTAQTQRITSETKIGVELELDAGPTARREISTGLGFLDHMLDTLATHAGFALTLLCEGDLRVDDHHTVEDTALTLGTAIDTALGDRAGIERFAHAFAPMDEALARCAIDLSGRPAPAIDLGLQREAIGGVACENIPHFFASLATASRCALHLDVLRGVNDHHRAEAAFKACALALGAAVRRSGDTVRSTKGVL